MISLAVPKWGGTASTRAQIARFAPDLFYIVSGFDYVILFTIIISFEIVII